MNQTPEYIIDFPEEERVGSVLMRAGRYVLGRKNGAELLHRSEKAELIPFRLSPGMSPPRPFDESRDWNGKRILIVRSGGFGDLLFVTPILREIKRRWPGAFISLACAPAFASVLQFNPHVDNLIAWPVSAEAWNTADAHCWLDWIMESDPRSKGMHAVDLLADTCGISLEDKTTAYVVTAREREWAWDHFPKKPGRARRLGVQVHASALNRTYPFPLLRQVLAALHARGWELMLFGSPEKVKDVAFDGVHVLTGLEFRESAAVISTCDVMLAPDSSLCHVAGALGIPTVSTYGPFHWSTRTAYQPSVHAIQGHADCAPCNHHDRPGAEWPPGCPGWQTGHCAALLTIEPRRVVAKIEAMADAQRKEAA